MNDGIGRRVDRKACASEDGVEVLFRGERGVCLVICW